VITSATVVSFVLVSSRPCLANESMIDSGTITFTCRVSLNFLFSLKNCVINRSRITLQISQLVLSTYGSVSLTNSRGNMDKLAAHCKKSSSPMRVGFFVTSTRNAKSSIPRAQLTLPIFFAFAPYLSLHIVLFR
jgi:hypothetical protein